MKHYIGLIIAIVFICFFYGLGLGMKKLAQRLLKTSRYHFTYVYSNYLAIWLGALVGLSFAAPFIVELFADFQLEAQAVIVMRILLTLIGLIAFLKFLNASEAIIQGRYDLLKADNIHERQMRTRFGYMKKILQIFSSMIAISIILLNFERAKEFGMTLLASAGLLTAILGFAAQRILANVLAGFQIAFTQSLRIDDVIFVEGEYGNVEEINLTYVVIRIWDKRRLILPVTYFSEKPFQNWTRTTADLIGTIFLYVDYHIDLSVLRQELERILLQQDLWDRKVANIQMTDASINGVELRILISASSAPALWDLRCIVREKMIAFLQSGQMHVLPKYRIKQE